MGQTLWVTISLNATPGLIDVQCSLKDICASHLQPQDHQEHTCIWTTQGLLFAAMGTMHAMDLGFVFSASREVSICGDFSVCWMLLLVGNWTFYLFIYWLCSMAYGILVPSLLFSRSVVSDSLGPHGLQHTRLPCPLPSPRVCSNSCPFSRWCHPTISSSVAPFSSCP